MAPDSNLGLLSKECFIHFTYFPLLSTWLDIIYDVERALKSQPHIHATHIKQILLVFDMGGAPPCMGQGHSNDSLTLVLIGDME